MEENKQEEELTFIDDPIDETTKYIDLLNVEIWDEAIRSYNDFLFALLRYS